LSKAKKALEGAIELLTRFYESPSLAHTRAIPMIDNELPALREALEELAEEEATVEPARPVGSILRENLKPKGDGSHWCREVLLYSPDNPGDRPESRVTLYTAGRLSDALDWAEKGVVEWRSAAQANARHAEAARATARVAIGHLQAVLNKARTHADQQTADTAARDWLISIGSDPE
jgi:hypothetical protein